MSKNKVGIIYIFLTIATLVTYWPVNYCDFIYLDDPKYVTGNTHIQHAITMQGVRWAFTTGYASNWHPLTWLSHMLDVQLFELKPRWHHLTNLLFHIANVLLLFFIFHRMTKSAWKSAFVAALFALHPLHVESVAWVAERKDVLSTFFWMLTMVAYVHYVERPRLGRYLVVIAFFTFGLMAKPMLVTLPFVLLLLDYWPLQRFEQEKSVQEVRAGPNKPANKGNTKSSGNHGITMAQKGVPAAKCRLAFIRPLLWEKVPFFALTAISSIVTFIAQQKGGAIASLEVLPPAARFANALVSYVIYMTKTICPNNLAFYYPYPGARLIWQVLGASLFLIAITITVILSAKRFPYLIFGWLWFTGTLVPVIGIVQVGGQAMADRYTYIPLIGLFIMAAWGIPELLKNWRYRKEALVVSSLLILSGLSTATWVQVGYWRNSMVLFDHALETTSRNCRVHQLRGDAYRDLGRYRPAIRDYDRAIEIAPKFAEAYNGRGNANLKLGNTKQAISDFDRAIEIAPEFAEAYNNRGLAYATLGNYRLAIGDYTKAIEINPKMVEAYNNRGAVYVKLENYRRALGDYDKAVEINSEIADIYYNRGNVQAKLGDDRQAISDYDRAIEINPEFADAYYERGTAHFALGNYTRAISDFDMAIEINPKLAGAYSNRGLVYAKLGSYTQAISDYNSAIEIHPDSGNIYYNRAVAHVALGHNNQAIEDLKTAARLNCEDAQNSLKVMGISW